MDDLDKFYDNTLRLIQKIWANIVNIRSILKSKEKFLLLVSIIIALILIFLIFYKLHKISFISFALCLNYFFIKAGIQLIRENITIKKYKGLSKIFANKVRLIKADKKNNIFILYSFISKAAIEKKINEVEHFLNREILEIERDTKNFRLMIVRTKGVKVKDNFLRYYYLEDYVNKIDRKKSDEIFFIVGLNKNNKILAFDLINLTNTFIAGIQGGGKSNLLNIIIQTMMYYNENIFYLMVDFKGGIELYQYNKFNNTVLVETTEQFLEKLKLLETEMLERYKKLKEDGVKKIGQYNLKNIGNKMPYIVVIIDEMSNIKLSKNNIAEQIEYLLTRIMNMGRASGIILIGATQRPSATQIDTNIRDRFGTKISARIKDPATQKMAGIKGTENLKDGEFLMEYIEEIHQFKAFFVDEIKHNKIYKILEQKYTTGGVKLDKFC